MQTRFVIVPAVPVEKESFQSGSRFYATTVSGGFDIYDNQREIASEAKLYDKVHR